MLYNLLVMGIYQRGVFSMSGDYSKRNRHMLNRFLPYYKKYTGLFVLDMLCSALTTVCEIALPLIVRRITDSASDDGLTLELIARTVAFYVLLRIIDTAASYFTSSYGHIMGAKIETDMRNDLFSHLQDMSYSFYDDTKIGQLMSRITSDLFDITELAHHGPENVLMTVVKIIAGFAMFASMNIWLAVIVFALMPLMLLLTSKSRRKMRDAFKQQRREIGEINARTEDSLLGIRVVKSFANEDIERKKFNEGSRRFFKSKKNGYKYMAEFHSTVRLCDGLMYITIVGIGAVFMMNGLTTVGDFSASLLMVSTLLSAVRTIVDFSEQFNKGMTGIERFTEVMDEVSDIKDDENAADLGEVSGEIEFKNVSFSYKGTDKKILSDFSLKIAPGENVALVGPSGGGKTTLCNLIPRFYDVDSGEILIDKTDIRSVTLSSLRANIGTVQQDVYMFSGTVKENIAYGCPGASDEDISSAAKRAGAHEFISALPEGYDTYVGERGVKLSGGQKQRISIARLFLKNPPIVILDEATSALDNESERLVQKSLEELAKGRTVITIAHRLTTIKNAAQIVVLTEDGIAEQGSHRELIEKGGLYSELYSMYSID